MGLKKTARPYAKKRAEAGDDIRDTYRVVSMGGIIAENRGKATFYLKKNARPGAFRGQAGVFAGEHLLQLLGGTTKGNTPFSPKFPQNPQKRYNC